jgi:hypothetical protein
VVTGSKTEFGDDGIGVLGSLAPGRNSQALDDITKQHDTTVPRLALAGITRNIVSSLLRLADREAGRPRGLGSIKCLAVSERARQILGAFKLPRSRPPSSFSHSPTM